MALCVVVTSSRSLAKALTLTQDVFYDDFIANFTAAKFNASAWVELFDDAGAKYFVFVTVRDQPTSLICPNYFPSETP
jgi:hypothetical protein